MEEIRLNEQIAYLRHQKNMTQEDLAKELGVTNQAVSKWESSQCCPDIQLLPKLAKLFDVSIDELMGYKMPDTFENIYLKIRSLFKIYPKETAFHNAYRLAVLLHEAACSRGYKGYIPWDIDQNQGIDELLRTCGFSACSEPEGITVYTANGVFIADGTSYQSPSPSQILDLYQSLERLTDRTVLTVMYAIYEMTVHDFDVYVSLEEITAKTGLQTMDVKNALGIIPVTINDTKSENLSYRIHGSYMHIPSLLLLLSQR